MQPLDSIKVLEFGGTIPVSLATLVLAEAGADVVKVEAPGGEPLRARTPKLGEEGLEFALLNRGKRSVVADFNDSSAIDALLRQIAEADVIVEGLRPGRLEEIGLGYDAAKAVNPAIIYCSLTGWGQDGPRAGEYGEDLNYLGMTGLLRLAGDAAGRPTLPLGGLAHWVGGAMPGVINILFALRQRDQSGEGCYLDIAVCDSLFGPAYWAIGRAEASGHWPTPGGETLTGGSPRYRIYPAADGEYVAVAALDDRHWENLCERLNLEESLRDDTRDPEATHRALAALIAAKPARHWRDTFENRTLCASVINDLQQAMSDPQFRGRGLFRRKVSATGETVTAAAVPVAELFRNSETVVPSPGIGADQAALDDGE